MISAGAALGALALSTLALAQVAVEFPATAGTKSSDGHTARAMGLAVDRNHVFMQSREGGVFWVRGRSYKARVAPDGFTYIPFLGAHAPRNYPVGFRLSEAKVGEGVLALADVAQVSQEGQRFVLDRGAVQVIYDMGVDQVEQSFALELPGARGDLTLTMEVATDLDATSLDGSFQFGCELGGMHYGEAVVLDSEGRRAPVDSKLKYSSGGTFLVLTVPGSFVASAGGSIVVDPILTTFGVVSFSGIQQNPDVGYEVGFDRYVYIFEDVFSAADGDIRTAGFSATGSPFGVSSAHMDLSDEDWRDPSIAFNQSEQGLAVAVRNASPAAPSAVIGKIYRTNPNGGNFSPIDLGRQISTGISGVTVRRPDVGGSTGAAQGPFMVVWENDYGSDSDVGYRLEPPAGPPYPPMTFDISATDDSTHPVVSESAGDQGAAGRWNVGFINEDLNTGRVSVREAQFDVLGALVTPPVDILNLAPGAQVTDLDISDTVTARGGGQVHAAVYQTSSSAGDGTLVAFMEDGGTVRSTVNLHRSEHVGAGPRRGEVQIATTVEDFVVTYLEETPTGYGIFATAFDLSEGVSLAVSERRTKVAEVVGGTVAEGRAASLTSTFPWENSTQRRIVIGWTDGTPTAPEVAGAYLELEDSFSPAHQFCFGNVNSTGGRGFIRMSETPGQNSTQTLVASGLPPQSFGYFLVSRSEGTTVNPGGSAGTLCLGGEIGRYSNSIAQSGADGVISLPFDPTQIPQPTGAVSGSAGDVWHFTLWHRDSDPGSPAPTSNFTNAIRLILH